MRYATLPASRIAYVRAGIVQCVHEQRRVRHRADFAEPVHGIAALKVNRAPVAR